MEPSSREVESASSGTDNNNNNNNYRNNNNYFFSSLASSSSNDNLDKLLGGGNNAPARLGRVGMVVLPNSPLLPSDLASMSANDLESSNPTTPVPSTGTVRAVARETEGPSESLDAEQVYSTDQYLSQLIDKFALEEKANAQNAQLTDSTELFPDQGDQPVIEGMSLSCPGRDLTIIPKWWGDAYGSQVRTVDLSYNQLTSVSYLEKFLYLETLVLDNNNLGDDLDFPRLITLKTLSLNNNNISNLENFLKNVQTSFPNLEYLSVLKNPICRNDLLGGDDAEYQRYRDRAIYVIRSLKFLDSRPISDKERQEAIKKGDISYFSTESADASVVSYETRTDETQFKRFTLYKLIVVDAQGVRCCVHRRYNDFYELHQKLIKAFPDAKLDLPPKKLLGNFDPKFIDARRKALHEYLQAVLGDPEMRKSKAIEEFLGNDMQILPAEMPKQPKDKLNLEDFNMLKVIGKGNFGKVLLAHCKKDGKLYAIKVLSKKMARKPNDVERIMQEREVLMRSVKHPFLIGLRCSFQTADKLCFVMDYVNGGELFVHLQKEKRFPEHRARFYAAEIVLAVQYLHSMGIIYRDLKPENILLDAAGHVALTDFGLAKLGVEFGDTTKTFCGTPEYLAPEVLKKDDYGMAVDWWCLGSVLYEMLVGIPPFYSRDVQEMYRKILNGKVKFPPHISENARDLISRLLEKDPAQRLGSFPPGVKPTKDQQGQLPSDAEAILAHPFFRGVDWDRLYRKEYKPPFNPGVSGQLDLRHFDVSNLESSPSVVSNSSDPSSLGISLGDKIHVNVEIDDTFFGFSYTSQSLMNGSVLTPSTSPHHHRGEQNK